MSTTDQSVSRHSHRISALRLAMTGALSMGVFYILCWSSAALGILPISHMYLQLFSSAPMSSTAMLAEGASWSVAFGLLAGALSALLYNAFGRLDRRN